MRKIQIERKLFELLGTKFFVFENFEDADLDIDDVSVYPEKNSADLVDFFSSNQFFAIWGENRRINANVICACQGHLGKIVHFLKNIKVPNSSFSTFNCGLRGEGRVLFLSDDTFQLLQEHLNQFSSMKNSPGSVFFVKPTFEVRKTKISQF